MMTTSRTTACDVHCAETKESFPGRSHDLRWLRLDPQLLGAHAARGRTKLIEHVDVALAHALGAPQFLAGEEPRFGPIADRKARPLAETAEHGGGDLEVVGIVVGDRHDVAFHE